MQYRIPERDDVVEIADFTKYFRTEDKQVNNHFQQIWKIDLQCLFYVLRNGKQHQGQQAQKTIEVVPCKKLTDKRQDDKPS